MRPSILLPARGRFFTATPPVSPIRHRLRLLGLVGLLLPGCKAAPDGLALVGATLIDGSGGPPLADAAVVVRRGRIESVGTRATFELPQRTSEVDVTGRWILPG